MASVLIAGGTGLIGHSLSKLLQKKGYQVTHLSRKEHLNASFPAYAWDIKKGTIDERAIQQVDYIVHLAGAGIADKPWTKARKKIIIDSRVHSTRLLRDAIQKYRPDLKAYIAASAIGYYGEGGDRELTEKSEAGTSGFLAKSVDAWERAIEEVAHTGIRTVGLRLGIVLSTQAGALPKMLRPAKFGANTYFGDGQQWYAWVHERDVCRLFLYAMEQPTMQGFYNGTAPYPVRNKTFAEELGKVINRPLLMPAPRFALRLAMGELADVVLTSAKVLPERSLSAGFTFEFEHLGAALEHLLSKKNND